MIALRRLLENKGIFVNARTIQQRREKYERATNPIKAFMTEKISPDSVESDKVYKEDLYRAYVKYCNEAMLPFESKENFGKAIKAHPYYIKDGRDSKAKEPRERFWKGIKMLNEDIEQNTLDLDLDANNLPSESWHGRVRD